MNRLPLLVWTTIAMLAGCDEHPTTTDAAHDGALDAAVDARVDSGRDTSAHDVSVPRDVNPSDAADAWHDGHRDTDASDAPSDATADGLADTTRSDVATDTQVDVGCVVPATTTREVLVRPDSQNASALRGTFWIGPVGAFGPAADDETMSQVRATLGMIAVENQWPPCGVPTSTFACETTSSFFARLGALRAAYPDITFARPVQTAEGAFWVDGEIAVGLRDVVPREQVLAAYAATGVMVQDAGSASDRVFSAGDVYRVTEQLTATGLFRYVEPNIWVCTPQ